MPGLRVQTASAETLLALKVLAHRVGEDDSVSAIHGGRCASPVVVVETGLAAVMVVLGWRARRAPATAVDC